MEKEYFNLMQFFEGYVRNYRRMNLSYQHNQSMFTQREVDYFANLGEMLGFDIFIEDSKFDRIKGRSRPMDLSWWKWDATKSNEHYDYLALHLERENVWEKDLDTVEKLFSETEEGYIPRNVIGIQRIKSAERIDYLNNIIAKKNAVQKSAVLMIYRYYDASLDAEKISAHFFAADGWNESREAICKQDETGYWFMYFEEEQPVLN